MTKESYLVPDLLWDPNTNSRNSDVNMIKFIAHLNSKYELNLASYEDLYLFSINYYHVLWAEIAEFSGIIFKDLPAFIVDMDKKISDNPKWFYQGTINFAENMLIKNIHNEKTALIQACEDISKIFRISYRVLFKKVSKIAFILKNKYAIQKGDCVVGYLPTGILAVTALLATTSLGAIWSSVSPDFGINGILDRFDQIKPKLMFTVNGVLYNGKAYEHLTKVRQVVVKLPSLECLVIDNHIDTLPLTFDLNGLESQTQSSLTVLSLDSFLSQTKEIICEKEQISPLSTNSIFFSKFFQELLHTFYTENDSQNDATTQNSNKNHAVFNALRAAVVKIQFENLSVSKITSLQPEVSSFSSCDAELSPLCSLWKFGKSCDWIRETSDWEYFFDEVYMRFFSKTNQNVDSNSSNMATVIPPGFAKLVSRLNLTLSSDDLSLLYYINPEKYQNYVSNSNRIGASELTVHHEKKAATIYSVFRHKFEHFEWSHPVYILYSSGTTGLPKCIVHGAGGTLIQHAKEHLLHGNIQEHYITNSNPTFQSSSSTRTDRNGKSALYDSFVSQYNNNTLSYTSQQDSMLYYTSTTWMMFNWLVSVLFTGNTLVLYDGSPTRPQSDSLYRLLAHLKVTTFGTSAKFLHSSFENKLEGMYRKYDLSQLKLILSTGSPLAPVSFDYVYQHVSDPKHELTDKKILLSSISGGSDIVSCFFSTNYMLPVYRGHLQSRNLGMAVYAYNMDYQPKTDGKDLDSGIVYNESGELVCIKPFPCMPVSFFNDNPHGDVTTSYQSLTHIEATHPNKEKAAWSLGQNLEYINEHEFINRVLNMNQNVSTTPKQIDYNREYDNARFKNHFICIHPENGRLCVEETNYINPSHFKTENLINDETAFCNPLGPKYKAAYFEKIDGIWCHGDYVVLHTHDNSKKLENCPRTSSLGNESIVILGRSDGILNPVGVRFGSAEIYNIIEEHFSNDIADSLVIGQIFGKNKEDERVILFVQPQDWSIFDGDYSQNEKFIALVKRIQLSVRENLSPRHVPSFIFPVKDIPYTTSGKKVEVAVKKIIRLAISNLEKDGEPSPSDMNANKNSTPVSHLHLAALRNPESVQHYHDLLPTLMNC